MSEEKLSKFLETGTDWEKLKTSVPGVFIQKLPPYRSSPARLAVEVNPVDASGNPTKRRGLLLRYIDEFETFREILNDEKLPKLLEMLDAANPGPGRGSRQKRDDVIEI
ncbi:MAG TPA: hypothetical protein VM050_11600 [Patescibacteria group bacterium]|jgi:hypothetical protein|nr:hypothetical protein [Patescibacteria group bacterium]